MTDRSTSRPLPSAAEVERAPLFCETHATSWSETIAIENLAIELAIEFAEVRADAVRDASEKKTAQALPFIIHDFEATAIVEGIPLVKS